MLLRSTPEQHAMHMNAQHTNMTYGFAKSTVALHSVKPAQAPEHDSTVLSPVLCHLLQVQGKLSSHSFEVGAGLVDQHLINVYTRHAARQELACHQQRNHPLIAAHVEDITIMKPSRIKQLCWEHNRSGFLVQVLG